MKPLLGRILLFGALGFMITVAMCWWLALRTDRITSPRLNLRGGVGMSGLVSDVDHSMWIFHAERSAAEMRMTASNIKADEHGGFGDLTVQWYLDWSEVPTWSVIRRGDPRGVVDAYYNEQAVGWPLLAMIQCERTTVVAGRLQRESDGMTLPESLRRHVRGHVLPLRLLWLGTIIDSAIWGWVCFAISAFPGVVVRAHRRRRNRCQSCGYDLRGTQSNQCSECGAALEQPHGD